MHLIPDEIRSAGGCAVRFHVSDGMVQAFAALTGDRSALHVSDAFARRSAYRRPVVHGMLPIGFIALLDHFQIDGLRCVPVAMTGHFAAPVYAGDPLVLSAELAGIQAGKDAADFNYLARNEASGAIVTRGSVRVVYERAGAARRSSAVGGGAGMLPDPPEMQNARLEE